MFEGKWKTKGLKNILKAATIQVFTSSPFLSLHPPPWWRPRVRHTGNTGCTMQWTQMSARSWQWKNIGAPRHVYCLRLEVAEDNKKTQKKNTMLFLLKYYSKDRLACCHCGVSKRPQSVEPPGFFQRTAISRQRTSGMLWLLLQTHFTSNRKQYILLTQHSCWMLLIITTFIEKGTSSN